MNSNFSVPDPCSVSWNKMQPQQNGRYCGSCRKVVIDFTNKTSEEILAYLAAHPGKSICGAFKARQLPAEQSSTKDERTIRFLAAALVVFGMSLFSCNPDDHPQAGPEESETLSATTLPAAPNTNDPKFLPPDTLSPQRMQYTETTFVIPPVLPVVTEEELIIAGITDMDEPPPPPVPETTASIEPPASPEPLVVGMIAGNMPEFIGGDRAMKEYLSGNINVQGEIPGGTVYVSFVIKADGSVDDVRLLRGLSPEQDAEALRVVKSMPKWKPGFENGKPVDVKFNLPIKFQMK